MSTNATPATVFDYSSYLIRSKEQCQAPMPSLCPYCRCSAAQVYADEDTTVFSDGRERILRQRESRALRVFACPCGWWSSMNSMQALVEYPETGYSMYDTIGREGILRSFSPADAEVPTASLIKYLQKHPSRLRALHPKQMELTVAAVFREHYQCKVSHCGRTGDGGVDLYVLDANSPLLVQVKRHATPSIESVETVRHLLGAVLLKGHHRASIVTTARRFSRQAVQAASEAVKRRLLTEFTLVDFDHFAGVLRLVAQAQDPPWKRYAVEGSSWRTEPFGPTSSIH